jgi:SAM-dependent methyltransferase
MNLPGQVQSEIRLKNNITELEYPTIVREDVNYLSAPGHTDLDFTFLAFECNRAEVVGLCLASTLTRVLVLGTGAGIEVSFIARSWPNVHITTIDISEFVVQIGTDHFGFQEGDRITSLIQDAVEFINTPQNEAFDAIIIDINSNDIKDMVPPKEFRMDGFIAKAKNLLTPDGVLIYNTIVNDYRFSFNKFKLAAKKHFPVILGYDCEEESNEIFYLPKGMIVDSELLASKIELLAEARGWDSEMEMAEIARAIKTLSN